MAHRSRSNVPNEGNNDGYYYDTSYNPYANMQDGFYRQQTTDMHSSLHSNVPAGSSSNSNPNSFNISNVSTSNLTATAKEFKPNNNYLNGDAKEFVPGNVAQASRNTGALKKTYHDDRLNRRYDNRNYPRQTDNKRNSRFRNNFNTNRYKEQRNKTVQETAEFFHKINHSHVSVGDTSTSSSESKDIGKVHDGKNKEYVPYNQKSKSDFYKKTSNKYEHNSNKTGKGNKTYSYGKFNRNDDADKKSNSNHFENWRSSNRSNNVAANKADAGSQRERQEQMITQKKLDCLVCCERIQSASKIWSCKQCYHILHFDCTIRWARSSVKSDSGWRCPACQNVKEDVPEQDYCYCGKIASPRFREGTLPHSCGDVCQRTLRNCDHKCPIVCHPGPCPDCNLTVTRRCGCGTTSATVKCSSNVEVKCTGTCGKLLKCEQHECKSVCHGGDCKPCQETIEQICFCGKVKRSVECTEEVRGAKHFECGDVCGKPLTCGNHTCPQSCHIGECLKCSLAPDEVQSCPCGQTSLNLDRTSCLDPVACCDKVCKKTLKCGHECVEICHVGPCPDCKLTTTVRCCCGHMDMEIACTEFIALGGDSRCKKKCNKKLLCGKHKCKELCCIDQEHRCILPCNRQLSCGLHRCPLTCHSYRCPPCTVVSFDELYCECGASVSYPPVPCGARPPTCSMPCSRNKTCGHEISHTCHTGPCPPCTVLSVRWCYGRHEKRATIPCYQEDFSCGLPCKKNMPCGRHTCIQPCHKGACPTPCTQPCTEVRSTCGHPCNAPCHEPPCPETPCKQIVRVTCQCGLRTSTRPCLELTGEYQSIAVAQLASKMAEMQNGHTVDISDIVSNQRKIGTLKTLECNEECRKVERNRRLAIGLQIRNPDLTAKLTPRYSDFMRAWAKKDPRFCQNVHDKLTDLVQLAKESKQKSRSYSFDSMNRDKRHFIHEYCEHFGCDSEAYDQEPNRNVVATAFRDKSWLPSVSLLELIQRENGHRKVPGPMLSKSATTKSETVLLRLPGRTPRPPTPPGEYIDYFDNPPV